MNGKPPLVIIALDSGDSRLIRPWMDAGYLPNLARLAARGCWRGIAGPDQISEHGSWESVWSGQSRARHGGYSFRQLKPGSYDLCLIGDGDIAAAPFWAQLHGSEQTAAVIGAPQTNLVAGLGGIQLAHWATHQVEFPWHPPQAEPQSLLAELPPENAVSTRTVNYVAGAGSREHERHYRETQRLLEIRGALYRRLLQHPPVGCDRYDLVVAGFFEAHGPGHLLWPYHTGAAHSETLRFALRDLHTAIDREIGELLAPWGDEANVIVVSPYGLRSQYPTTGLTEAFMTRLGYQVPVQGTGRRVPIPLSLARRILPQAWRNALGARLSRAQQEMLLAGRLRNETDWGRTRAFAIPSLYESLVRVNLRGREPRGIVAPGGEYRQLLDQLENDFRQLIDPQTGRPAIKHIVRTVDQYHCGESHPLPDLFVYWADAQHSVSRVVHPKATLNQEWQHYHRNSGHHFEGFLLAAGPSIRARGADGVVDTLDLAPTFLDLIGTAVPAAMSGRPLRELFQI